MRKNNLYEVTVERKVRETHTVVAPTRTEAAIAFAQPDFQSVNDVTTEVVDERVLTPHLVEAGYDPDQTSLAVDDSEKTSK